MLNDLTKMNQEETDILLNTFFIKKKRYRALLNFNTIIWEREPSSKGNDKTIIPVSDIIFVESTEEHQLKTGTQNVNTKLCLQTSSIVLRKDKKYLTIHYAKRVIKSPRDCNRWRKQSVVLQSCDPNIILKWHVSIQNTLKAQNRIRKVLVFINPFGGQKRGHEIYAKYCKPLFLLANIDASCIISQRANQIHEILMTYNLEQYDAVCCVGGDGTFAEVINGLLFRAIKDLDFDVLRPKFIPKPKMPVAVIPAGSTDTVAYSLHGTHDVITAAIHLVLGQKRGMDICSIENSNGLIRFCASVMSYGYLGDVAMQSEKYRWMGTKRYEYTGIKQFLMNNAYQAEIRVLSDSNDENSVHSMRNIDQFDSGSQQIVDEQKCFVNCNRCQYLSTNTLISKSDSCSTLSGKSRNEVRISCANEVNNVEQDCDNYLTHSDIGLNSRARQNDTEKRNLNIFDSASSNNFQTWKIIKGDFFMVSGANITCACSRSPNGISKYSHLGDGSIDLILVHKASLLNNVRLLLKMINRNADIRDLPFVEMYRTKQFCFRAYGEDRSWDGSCSPIANDSRFKTSQWNCDGEVIHDLEILMSCHCQLMDVFMRGPYPFIKEISTSACCSGLCIT